MSEFPIGFWNYPSLGNEKLSEAARWKHCGMTASQSPRFSYDRDKKEDFTAMLDACEAQGVKLYLCVGGLEYPDYGRDPAAYRARFERAYADFGRHPATLGFFIGDEPYGREQLDACIGAYKLQLELAPELTPFLNFNPYYEGYERDVLGGQKFADWGKDFAAASGCRLICYDCYAQLNPEIEGTDMYFLNLRKYSEMAEAAHIELWVTLLSCGHFRYRVPTEDDLRWQVSTAAACGARGIIWFLYYNNLANNNYRGSPVDEFGEETATYTALSRVLRVFQSMYGNLLMSLRRRETYCFGRCFGGYEAFPASGRGHIRAVRSWHGLPGVVSFFADRDGAEYAVLVNNSPFEPDGFVFDLDRKTTRIERIELNGSRVTDFAKYHHDAIYSEHDDRIEAGCWLAPGQMEVFRIG